MWNNSPNLREKGCVLSHMSLSCKMFLLLNKQDMELHSKQAENHFSKINEVSKSGQVPVRRGTDFRCNTVDACFFREIKLTRELKENLKAGKALNRFAARQQAFPARPARGSVPVTHD